MRIFRTALWVVLIAGLALVGTAGAQETDLKLSFSRDFGYSSGGGDIQGLFTITASGPADLAKVVFYIDDQVLGEVDRAPFKLQFNTDDFPRGAHRLQAIGTGRDGRELKSQVVEANFVSAEEGMRAGMRIAIPILAVVFGAILVSALFPLLTGRKTASMPAGTRRSYPLGGTVCPRCGRPFALHFFSLNLLTGKLERCPYCGRWSIVRRESLDKLRAAEEAELMAVSKPVDEVGGLTEEEKLKKELDESRYREP